MTTRPDDGARTVDDDGRALIEVVFLAVLLLIPVVYILIAVPRLQSATLAVTQAARDVGRLIETTEATTADTAGNVARYALRDQHIDPETMHIRVVAPGGDCTSPEVSASHRPGATYNVCVIAGITLPGVPSVLAGANNTVTGVYTVHIGELHEGP